MKIDTDAERPDIHASRTGPDRITISQKRTPYREGTVRVTIAEALALADCLVDLVETPNHPTTP